MRAREICLSVGSHLSADRERSQRLPTGETSVLTTVGRAVPAAFTGNLVAHPVPAARAGAIADPDVAGTLGAEKLRIPRSKNIGSSVQAAAEPTVDVAPGAQYETSGTA